VATFLEEHNYVRMEMGCVNETISPYIGYQKKKVDMQHRKVTTGMNK
jgi:hypothetical protein